MLQSKSGKNILITGELFISEENEKQLAKAGFVVSRLNKNNPSEDKLCRAIKGKSFYIIGGNEKITSKIIDSADKLKAIIYTGSGYKRAIPVFDKITKRGIAIANVPGANAESVAEFAVALILLTCRNLLEIGRTGKTKFMTTDVLSDHKIGIIGLGHVGFFVAKYLKGLNVKQIYYYSRTRKPNEEKQLGIKYAPLDYILKNCDVITIHVSHDAGENFISAKELKLMKSGSILINTAYPEAVSFSALRNEIKSGRIRAAFDEPPDENYADIPEKDFFCSNVESAYNTNSALRKVSEIATKSAINLISTGNDKFIVNPLFRKYKSMKK